MSYTDSNESFAGAGCNQHCLNVHESKAVSSLEKFAASLSSAKLHGQVDEHTNAKSSVAFAVIDFLGPQFFGGDVKRHRRTLQVHINNLVQQIYMYPTKKGNKLRFGDS